ncbi:hypothetical protein FRC17_001078 [Serendipita sp. 399]|nr:hypothetical protein FRC17_001078 [Serendipita sp. 399]
MRPSFVAVLFACIITLLSEGAGAVPVPNSKDLGSTRSGAGIAKEENTAAPSASSIAVNHPHSEEQTLEGKNSPQQLIRRNEETLQEVIDHHISQAQLHTQQMNMHDDHVYATRKKLVDASPNDKKELEKTIFHHQKQAAYHGHMSDYHATKAEIAETHMDSVHNPGDAAQNHNVATRLEHEAIHHKQAANAVLRLKPPTDKKSNNVIYA